MKKIVAIIVVIGVVALIIFTLFNNRAEMKKEARLNSNRAVPVAVATVSRHELNGQLTQAGLINANSDINIVSELQGRATAVLAQEGSYVSAGSTIVKVENKVPEANFLAAQNNYQKAQKDWKRSNELHKEGLISESDLESARQTFKAAEAQFVSAQYQYNSSEITSPISGIVTSIAVDVGTMLNPGMTVANVVDISKLKVVLNVAEQDAFRLKVGDQAEVETTIYPGVKFFGKIASISVKGDAAHTYPVKILIPNNKQHPLKSGMFGQITIKLGNQVGLAIPRTALVGSAANQQVFVVEGGKAILRDIQAGSEVGTNIVVLQGLREGEMVVVSGQQDLKDSMAVFIQNNVFSQNSVPDSNLQSQQAPKTSAQMP
jgi:RND family efflux transporter MFP subunit